jgi:hypothetical protein
MEEQRDISGFQVIPGSSIRPRNDIRSTATFGTFLKDHALSLTWLVHPLILIQTNCRKCTPHSWGFFGSSHAVTCFPKYPVLLSFDEEKSRELLNARAHVL